MIPESDNDLYGWVQQMKRTREMLEMRERQKAAEAPRVYREPEVRATPEPMAKAIKRHTKRGVKRRA